MIDSHGASRADAGAGWDANYYPAKDPPHSGNGPDCPGISRSVILFSVEMIAATAVVLYALYFILKWIRRPANDICACNRSKLCAAALPQGCASGMPGKQEKDSGASRYPYSTIDAEACLSGPFHTNKYPKSIQQQFTLAEVMQITDNLRVKLGQGGFGSVYYGKLFTGQKVAVKRLSWASSPGSQGAGSTEFMNEVALTSLVSHRNLVSMIGHCCELDERIIIYEYMPKGALQDHLYGREAGRGTLDWERRLRIAIDTASGLDYLHTICKPAIVHRDVKSSNILLDDSFQAKVADFGISKLLIENPDYSNGIKGTVGYLDPEYFASQRANDKSDVYAFGIVLLELICGRQALVPSLEDPSKLENIVDWVNPYLERKDFDAIVDKNIKWMYNEYAMGQVLNIALMCVKHCSLRRPSMRQICEKLTKALKMELEGNHIGYSSYTKSTMCSISF